MSDYSLEDAARRAGVETADVRRFVELGVVRPKQPNRFTAGDIRQIGLVATIADGGLPLDGLADQIQRGRISLDFLSSPAFDHFSALSDVTFADLADRTGIPVELLMVIREAVGSAVPVPTDFVREIEHAIVPLIEVQLDVGYTADVVDRMLRTMGDSLRRYVLAEADAFRVAVIVPVADRTGEEIGAAAASATGRLRQPVENALMAVYRAQEAHAWTQNMLEGFEQDLVAAGLIADAERQPAMCFLDIAGYSRLTDERGDRAAAELADHLGRLVQRSAVGHGGRPIKWLGDGVMIWFREPGRGVIAALEMVEGVAASGLPPAHVGLHSGPVLLQDGDYYGLTVNLASRIADYARPGEVLVSQAVVEASAGAPVAFTEIGPVELKGVAGSVRLHIAEPRSG